jgi:hypothetical protein
MKWQARIEQNHGKRPNHNESTFDSFLAEGGIKDWLLKHVKSQFN